MNWLAGTLTSSIGKKLMMAITGLSFCMFLVLHLAGNLTLFGGRDLFNSYAGHLESLSIAVVAAEWILLFLAAIHIGTGMILFYQNVRARPRRYKVNKRAGGRTIGSGTMPYTGLLLLAFVVFHLINFRFVDKAGTTIYDIVAAAFSHPLYVAFYVVAMIMAAVHVSHGFWSAFQTIGANHPKYMPLIWTLTVLLALIFGIGFGILPIYVSLSA